MKTRVFVLLFGLVLVLGPALVHSQDTPPSGKGGKGSKSGKSKMGGFGEGGPGGGPGGGKSKGSKGGGPSRSEMTIPRWPGGGELPGAAGVMIPQRIPGMETGSRGTGPGGRGTDLISRVADSDTRGTDSGSRGNMVGGGGIDSWFRRADLNGDGALSYDEMDEGLQAERANWDLNGDGFIEQAEYTNYFQAHMRQVQAERAEDTATYSPASRGESTGGERNPGTGFSPSSRTSGAGQRGMPVDSGRVTVYRPGNLPRELPSWFQEYDRDNDGQVAVYEWRARGESLERFQRLDPNNDGFITVEEVLRSQATETARTAEVAEARGGFVGRIANPASMASGPGSRGGPGPGSRDTVRGPSSSEPGKGPGRGPGGPGGGRGR